jgi:DNA-binding winged helix-turn-helix (wHTH) protein/tetratricopeptide (TPR) repeat protein
VKSFHPFRLDPVNHCLWRGEERVPLSPKAFDLLHYLIERRDRVVPQEEILESLWPHSYVNPEIVKKYILGIRNALGDRRDQPMFIETVPKRGYRFVAPARDESNAAPFGLLPDAATRIVGRAAPRGQLNRALERALNGQRQMLFITGEAGAGKTALIDWFQQRVAGQSNIRTARGQCIEGFAGKEAYYPLLEALGPLLHASRSGSVVQTFTRRAPTWTIQFPALLSTKQKELLRRELLGASPERMLREICEALESLTSTNPLLLILEDLHEADPATLDFISALARRRASARLLLLGTYRGEAAGNTTSRLKSLKQDLIVRQLCQEVALERLTEQDIGEYLTTEFPGSALPASLSVLVHRHCGGNPLLMVAIVRDLVRNGLIVQSEGEWRLSAAPERIEVGVPQTLQQLLELQLEEMSSVEQRVLRSASVAGERFCAWEIARAAELEPEQIEEVCEQLAERQRFIRSAGIHELPGGTVSAHYEFLHALHREFLYGGLAPVNRSRLHRNVAEQLVTLQTSETPQLAPVLALHFEEGREYPRAIRWLLVTAQTAARRFAHRESIERLQHALALVSRVPPAERIALELQLLERIGDAHYVLGAMSKSVNAYELQAARAKQAMLAAAEAHALMCQAAPLGLVDPDRAVAVMEQAVQVSQNVADDMLRARAQFMAAVWRLLYGTWTDADWETCSSLDAALHTSEARCLTEHDEMFWLYVQCLRGESAQVAHASSVRMQEASTLMGYLGAVGARTVALLLLGQFGEVQHIISEARAMAERNGYNPWLLVFREAWLHVLVFDFPGAQRLCDSIIRDHTDVPPGQPMAIARLAAGHSALEQARYEQAADCFEQIRDVHRTPKFFLHWYWRLQAQLGLTEVRLAAGNLTNARSEAASLLEASLKTAEPTLLARAWEISARVAMATDQRQDAYDCIQNALTIVQRSQVPLAAWLVHTTAADLCLRSADPHAAETHRQVAAECIRSLADSLTYDEALRTSLLTFPSVRRALR